MNLYTLERGIVGKGEVTIFGSRLSDFAALRLFRNGYHLKIILVLNVHTSIIFLRYVSSMELKNGQV